MLIYEKNERLSFVGKGNLPATTEHADIDICYDKELEKASILISGKTVSVHPNISIRAVPSIVHIEQGNSTFIGVSAYDSTGETVSASIIAQSDDDIAAEALMTGIAYKITPSDTATLGEHTVKFALADDASIYTNVTVVVEPSLVSSFTVNPTSVTLDTHATQVEVQVFANDEPTDEFRIGELPADTNIQISIGQDPTKILLFGMVVTQVGTHTLPIYSTVSGKSTNLTIVVEN